MTIKTSYCTISINSAGPVTCDGPAENLVSVTTQSSHDIPKFLGIFWQFSAAGDEKNSILVTWLPNEFGTPEKSPWQQWHFSFLEGPVMCDCWIEWNGTIFYVTHASKVSVTLSYLVISILNDNYYCHLTCKYLGCPMGIWMEHGSCWLWDVKEGCWGDFPSVVFSFSGSLPCFWNFHTRAFW